MAGNNSIQILRGNNVKSTAADKILLDGQPLYDRTTGYLYVGENNTVANTQAVNAHYANSAGTASSATIANTRQKLYFNGNGTNVSWNGSSVDTIYVPTSVGSSGQVWGMRSNGTVGWVAQTEIPGTINHANTADVAYEVSGSNVSGSVANANYATTAGKVSHSFKLNVNGTTYTYNGSNVDIDILDDNPVVTLSKTTAKGAIVYTNATGRINWLSHPGVSGRVLTSGGDSNVSWSPPVQLYAIEDLGSNMYIVFSSPFGSTDSIAFFNSLTAKGYDSATNPFRVVYGVRDGKPIRAIYANTTTSMTSTRFTIMYLDDSTQFVSYNGTSPTNPGRLTIHPLSHYQDLGST